MKVIVDNKIPFIKEAIGKIADEVIYVPGKDFAPALVKDADALIIRTRTQCNRELLQRKPGTIHCYSHNRLRSYRYGVLPRSRHNSD